MGGSESRQQGSDGLNNEVQHLGAGWLSDHIQRALQMKLTAAQGQKLRSDDFTIVSGDFPPRLGILKHSG